MLNAPVWGGSIIKYVLIVNSSFTVPHYSSSVVCVCVYAIIRVVSVRRCRQRHSYTVIFNQLISDECCY